MIYKLFKSLISETDIVLHQHWYNTFVVEMIIELIPHVQMVKMEVMSFNRSTGKLILCLLMILP